MLFVHTRVDPAWINFSDYYLSPACPVYLRGSLRSLEPQEPQRLTSATAPSSLKLRRPRCRAAGYATLPCMRAKDRRKQHRETDHKLASGRLRDRWKKRSLRRASTAPEMPHTRGYLCILRNVFRPNNFSSLVAHSIRFSEDDLIQK